MPKKRSTIYYHPPGEQSPQISDSLHHWGSPAVRVAEEAMHGSVYQIQSLTKEQLEALEQQQSQEFGVQFESSVSGTSSNSVEHHSEVPASRTPLLGLGILEKPLPEIPISANERARQTTLDKYLRSRQHNYSDPNNGTPVKQVADYNMGFSFRPGDEEDVLARRSTELERARRKAVDDQLRYRHSLQSLKTSGSYTPSSSHATPRRPILAHVQESRAKVSPKPTRLPRLQDNDHVLGRMDSSSSSIITALRDNSGRSSTNNSLAGRPKLERNGEGTGTGNSEAVSAVTAAARAYAASKKRSSSESARKGSGEVGRETKGNDDESSKNRASTRTASIASTVLSFHGTEVDRGKKPVGGMRLVDKS